jgi:arylsulfatase A-like enzyme
MAGTGDGTLAGQIQPGTVSNEIVHHMDWLADLPGCGGQRDVKEDLLEGVSSDTMGREYRVHLDGYNILPLLKGEVEESPREEIFYFTDDGDLAALRYANWKITSWSRKAWARPSAPGWSR